ncbi:MAG: hypothetical protein K0R67_3293 [Paenibacillus sp.]|nr:hypothetical protein [Paenibacillus sp.]
MLAGDADAFRTIIESHHPYLYRVALSVLHHPKDAEDAVQEAFLKIYFSLAQYQGHGFKTWMTRITVNTAIDHKRKLGRRHETETLVSTASEHDLDQIDQHDLVHAAASESVEDALLRKERAHLIARYINEIPDNYRQVVKAFYIDEKSQLQIAAEQGAALKTIESKLYRARHWMKKHWKEEDFR